MAEVFLGSGDEPAPASSLEGLLEEVRNEIGPDGADSLMSSPHLKDVTRLDLGQNPIGTRPKERLAALLSRRA